jgi:hypothetical protein
VIPFDKTTNVATYGGSTMAIFGGLNANELAAIGGILIGLIGLAVNVYFKWRHLKIAERTGRANPDE